MAFDLARAVQESFPGRSAFLDRLLSYLYFADVTAFEQTTWDDHGTGVSVIGLKGHQAFPGVLLAGPLPPEANGDPTPEAMARTVDLLARAWALSELDAEELPAPVALVAYRADPVGAALAGILDGGQFPATVAIAHAPVGTTPVEFLAGTALVHARFDLAPSAPRPARDILTARPAGGVEAAIRSLALAARAGDVIPLGPVSAAASDVGGPLALELTLALPRSCEVPPGWVVTSRPDHVRPGGAWTATLVALAGLLDELAAATGDAPIRLVSLEAGAGPGWADLVVDLPPGDGAAALADALDPVLGRPGAPWSGLLARRGPGVAGPGARALPGPASLLTAWVPRVLAMGPDPVACREDPAGTARDLARAYVDVLRRLLPPQRRTPAGRPA